MDKLKLNCKPGNTIRRCTCVHVYVYSCRYTSIGVLEHCVRSLSMLVGVSGIYRADMLCGDAAVNSGW